MKSPKAIEALEKKLQNDFWVRRLKRREGQKVTIVICVNFSGETSDILDERKPFSGVGRAHYYSHCGNCESMNTLNENCAAFASLQQ